MNPESEPSGGVRPLDVQPSEEWPVAWEPVEGDRDGAMAHVECLAVRGSVWLLTRLPWSFQRALARGLARIARRVDRRHSDSARAFLTQAFGPELTVARREELVLSAFEHLFLLTLEFERFGELLGSEDLAGRVELSVSSDVRRVQAEGRGALWLTGHIGVWELLPPLVARLGFRPLYLVSRPPRNRPLSRVAQRSREARGCRLLHRHGAASSIPKVIAAHGHVGLIVDQRARRKTVIAPFFGRPAHCERAVAVFARRLGVPVVLAACYRLEGRRYRAVIERVLWPADLAGRSLQEITARINSELERMIRLRPEQYFWLHDRFRGAPADAPGIPGNAASGEAG